MNTLYALAIIAHPDDESFLLAGTTMKFKEEGKEVAVICATRGEKGTDRLNRNLTEKEMAMIRTNELLTACDLLRCQCKGFFDYPDGGLEKIDFDELVSKLADEINVSRPKIILTFGEEGISGHRDHITIGKAAMEASKQANPKPEEIWLASIPASEADNFHDHMEKRKIHHLHFIANRLKGVPDNRISKIDISKYRERKIKALEAHQSQYVAHLTWEGFLRHECFEVIRL